MHNDNNWVTAHYKVFAVFRAVTRKYGEERYGHLGLPIGIKIRGLTGRCNEFINREGADNFN